MIKYIICALFFFSACIIADIDSKSDLKLKNSLGQIALSNKEAGLYKVQVSDYTLWAHPDVFSPKYFSTTQHQAHVIPFRPNQKYLEIGTGIGASAIIANKKYQNTVVAVDINHTAILIAKKNADELDASIDIRLSDVFSAIDKNEKFDLIFWDPPFVFAEKDTVQLTMLERAVCDPGYEAIGRYIAQAKEYLNPNGRILIGFSTLGNQDKFSSLIKKQGYQLHLIAESKPITRDSFEIIYFLYQIKV